MNKRSSTSGFYSQKKKFHSGVTERNNVSLWTAKCNVESNVNVPSDTESALIYLKSKFPNDKFEGRLPPVILLHQIYSIIECRTTVDKDVRNLQKKGIIRLFKLGGEETAHVVIYTSDFNEYISKRCESRLVINRFLKEILPNTLGVYIDKSDVREKYNLTENDISYLMSAGLLTLRSVTSFWFSFPNAGEFMRTYLKGRKSVLRTIKKCKFNEILQYELEQRKLEKSAKLGMMYHIHDIIGAQLVQCIDTTSGTLLRLRKSEKKKK